MEGLLFSNDIDTREFSAGALASLPFTESDEWKIDEMEFKYRKDLRCADLVSSQSISCLECFR